MQIMWPWLLLGLLLPVLAIALWRLRKPAKRPTHLVGGVVSANSLPSFAREANRARRLRIAQTTVLGLLILCLAIIAARPQQQIRKIDYQNSRDIVLCMDVSGSMKDYVPPALETLKKVVNANPTDRYSLVLFGNVPFVALPLTSDTTAMDAVLADLTAQFTDDDYSAADLVGFDPNQGGGTDIAAGLSGCFRRFDTIDQLRSRHIILVSDLVHNGRGDPDSIATLLPKYGIKLYILTPEFYAANVQKNNIVKITDASVESLKSDGSNAEATLTALFNTILTARQTDTYILADSPYPFWAAATVLAIAWAGLMLLRWRRK